MRQRGREERRRDQGRIKGEGRRRVKYGRDSDGWSGGGRGYRWNAKWPRFRSTPLASTHMHSSLVSRVSRSPFIPTAPTHTCVHTHAQREAINLSLSAAGIKTPKTGLCCVWRECRCTCLQHIILCPSSSLSFSSSPPLSFILPISLQSFLSHVLNPFQP